MKSKVLGLIGAGAMILALSACSGGSDTPAETGGAATGGETSASAGGVSEAVKALVIEAGGEQSWSGPTEGPIAEKDKLVVSIPCGLAASGCQRWDAGVHAAGEALGWEVHTIDPAFDPSKTNDAFTQAINLGADAIVFIAVDPALVSNSIAAARAAGIVVVSAATGMEDEPITENGIQHDVSMNGPLQGKWMAAALCEGIDGTGEALLVEDPQYKLSDQRTDGAADYLAAECPGITVTRQTATSADFGTVGQAKAAAVLQANPGISAILFHADTYAPDYLVAMQQLGLTDKIKLYGQDASEQAVELITQGGPIVASVGVALEQQGWATLDNVNRLLNGEEPAESDGVQIRMVNENWIPENGSYIGDSDFPAIYTELWTTGKTQG